MNTDFYYAAATAAAADAVTAQHNRESGRKNRKFKVHTFELDRMRIHKPIDWVHIMIVCISNNNNNNNNNPVYNML